MKHKDKQRHLDAACIGTRQEQQTRTLTWHDPDQIRYII
jgi:hypothetical protein